MGLETISIRYASLPQQHQLWAAGPACQNQAEKRVFLQKLISEETLKSTTKCQFDFACLEGNGFPKCVVDYSVKNNGVFIKQENDQRCPYKMAFGYSYICYCPTRYEIYEKYER